MTATVLSFLNFKGGVGKTSATALVSYNLAKMGKKCLVIDFDPQANITALFLKTKYQNKDKVATIESSLMTALNREESLDSITIEIEDNLYLTPNAVDFSMYSRFLERNFMDEKERIGFFKKKVDSLRDKYDFIFIDVPPTISLPNDTAFYACDQIIVVLQTQERSLQGAEVLIEYLQNSIVDAYDSKVDILGILPFLSKRSASVDKEILDAASEEFGDENIFNAKIMQMERVKRMDMTGITDNPSDSWDKKTHAAFKGVANEILERLGEE